MIISFFLMITVPGKPLPRFRVEAWLPFRNREMGYDIVKKPIEHKSSFLPLSHLFDCFVIC